MIGVKKKLPLFLTGLFLTCIIAMLYLMNPVFLRFMDNKIYDVHMQKASARDTDNQQTGIPIIVDIDEKSLKNFGQWPWPRYRISQLLLAMKSSGISTAGLDILFSEPDRTSLVLIEEGLKNYYKDDLDQNVHIVNPDLPSKLMDNDLILANTLKQTGYTIGHSFVFDGPHEKGDSLPENIPSISPTIIKRDNAKDLTAYLLKASSIITPLEILKKEIKNTGFLNTLPDEDGILRKTPLLISYNDRIYPGFSLAILLNALNHPPVSIAVTSGGVESMKIGKAIIPLDENAHFFINYTDQENQFKTYSASDFLENKITQDSLKGKIAILGSSAAGLKDLKATPFNPIFMGAKVHATIIENILTGDFIGRPDWAPGAEVCITLLFGLLITFLIIQVRPWIIVAVLICLVYLVFNLSLYFYGEQQIFLSPLFPLMVLFLNFSILSLQRFYYSEKDRTFLKKAFSNYVSNDLISEIVKNPGRLKLGGDVQSISVLFCDLANFTNISESRTPNEIVQIMSQYFEDMTGFVFDTKGTLIEYVGDELMALFGAPLYHDNHAIHACETALAMQKYLSGLKNRSDSRLPPLSARVGVNTGNMLVGNLGSKYRFRYTAMGDNVNLGSRLEGLNKIYGTKIIIGQNTAKMVKDHFRLRLLGLIRVKGRVTPEMVYELIGYKNDFINENHGKALECYETGYQHYLNQEWDDAIALFKNGLEFRPDDLSFTVMIQRCGMYKRIPHMEDFDGVFIERRK